jgi:muramoyltetrapeptide carboxypeptidase LdcA involved in peptidoglycan recycling
VADALGDLGAPIVLGLPIGHRWRDRTVPLGVPVRLDGGEASMEVLW